MPGNARPKGEPRPAKRMLGLTHGPPRQLSPQSCTIDFCRLCREISTGYAFSISSAYDMNVKPRLPRAAPPAKVDAGPAAFAADCHVGKKRIRRWPMPP
jgi:hypothetical protein